MKEYYCSTFWEAINTTFTKNNKCFSIISHLFLIDVLVLEILVTYAQHVKFTVDASHGNSAYFIIYL